MNDEQYAKKHGIVPTARGVKLAEEHVLTSIKSLGIAIASLLLASKYRQENGSDKESILQERARLADYRDACYDLFYVHVNLIKLCAPATLRRVNDLSLNHCSKATLNLHVTNL